MLHCFLLCLCLCGSCHLIMDWLTGPPVPVWWSRVWNGLVDRTTSAGVICACWKAVLVSATSLTSRTTCAGMTIVLQTISQSGTCSVIAAPARTMHFTLANHIRRPASDDDLSIYCYDDSAVSVSLVHNTLRAVSIWPCSLVSCVTQWQNVGLWPANFRCPALHLQLTGDHLCG